MTRPTIVGVDPGLTTGLAVLAPDRPVELAQITPGLVVPVIYRLLEDAGRAGAILAVEQFVVGPRAARSSTPAAGRTTRELIGALQALARPGVRIAVRTAATVKPWAIDARLAAAGVPVGRGMPHALDAARHALYSAVKDCGLPDPLSRRSTVREVRDA